MNETYTVTQITEKIRNAIMNIFSNIISIRGEVSNVKISRGHLYLMLKDDESAINIIMWSQEEGKYNLVNGDYIIVTGKISTYSKNGTYNIYASNIELIDTSHLNSEYEKTKKHYDTLGYFEKSRKKELPENITNIGIITAIDGAALQDIMYIINKNKFIGNIFIKNCLVQGHGCPESVVNAIRSISEYNYIDVIIITRGGGSYNDLMGFSDPKVIEAIYDTNICTISAIGHETDMMLSDFVADIRVPTPSIAGEIISRHQIETRNELDKLYKYFTNIVDTIITSSINRYESYIITLREKIRNHIQKINAALQIFEKELDNKMIQCIAKYENTINELREKLINCNPQNKINQGYVILLDSENKIIRSTDDILNVPNKKLKIVLNNGIIKVIYRYIVKV